MINLTDLSRENFIKDIKKRSPLELQALFEIDDLFSFDQEKFTLNCYLGDVQIGYSSFKVDNNNVIDWTHFYPLDNYFELSRGGVDYATSMKINKLHLGTLANASYVKTLEPLAQEYKLGHKGTVLLPRREQLIKMGINPDRFHSFSIFAKKSYDLANKKGFVF